MYAAFICAHDSEYQRSNDIHQAFQRYKAGFEMGLFGTILVLLPSCKQMILYFQLKLWNTFLKPRCAIKDCSSLVDMHLMQKLVSTLAIVLIPDGKLKSDNIYHKVLQTVPVRLDVQLVSISHHSKQMLGLFICVKIALQLYKPEL